MKLIKLHLFIVSILLSILCHSKDILFLNSGEEVESKVTEVELTVVKYYEYDHQDGPVRSVKKDNLFMIIYENGKRETFVTPNNTSNSVASSSSQPPDTTRRSNPSNFLTSRLILEYPGKKFILNKTIRIYWNTSVEAYRGFWGTMEFQGEEVGRGSFKNGFLIEIQTPPGTYNALMIMGDEGKGVIVWQGKISIEKAGTSYLASFKYNTVLGDMLLKTVEEI